MSTPVHDRYLFLLITFDPQTGQPISYFWPDQNGNVDLMTKEGYYYVDLILLDMSSGSTQEFMYADGWSKQVSQDALIYLSSGETIHLQDIVN